MSSLPSIVACSSAELGVGERLLVVAGRSVAIWDDADDISALVGRRGAQGSLVDTIAGLLSSRPSGVLVLGDGDGLPTLALLLRDGSAVAALAPGDLGTQSAWVLEFQQRRILEARGTVATQPVDACRTFLLETALRGLELAERPGGTLAWITGPLRWLGEELPVTSTIDASFLLLERARRADESERITAAIGAVDRVVVPISRPGPRACAPARAPKPVVADEDDWDFFDDPDVAADAEWSDARLTFGCCDGMTTIAELPSRTMLGGFRTMQALLLLLSRQHVTAVGAEASNDAPGHVDLDFEDVG